MSSRRKAALANRPGIALLLVGSLAALVAVLLPGGPGWLAVGSLTLGLLAYGLTVMVFLLTPEPVEGSEQVEAVRKLRASIAERLERPEHGETTQRILVEALHRVDAEMLPAVQQLTRRHALLRRDLRRFQTGELLAPDEQLLGQLVALRERQERAVEAIGRQVANAYASLIILTQQSHDEARVATDAERWSKELLETQRNLTELLDEEAAFDRALREGKGPAQS